MKKGLENKLNQINYSDSKIFASKKFGICFLALSVLFSGFLLGCKEEVKIKTSSEQNYSYECEDEDGDGYGKYCEKGDDCDDNDKMIQNYKRFYLDNDRDSFGDQNNFIDLCSLSPPSGYVLNNLDCNDNDPAINPNALEVCDGIDNNCNGQIDEGVQNIYYLDFDGDSYGDSSNSTEACSLPAGYVTNNSDCNDNNYSVNPGAVEICDSIDNNCNGQIDEGVKNTYYLDFDGDGYGNPNNSIQACSLPTGYSTNNSDCNDNNKYVYPHAPELCDLVDNQCLGDVGYGTTDEGCTKFTEEWNKVYNSGGKDNYAKVAVNSLGDVFIVGCSNKNFITIKYDTNGNEKWINFFGDSSHIDDGLDIATDSSGNVYVVGYTYPSGINNEGDIRTIKYDTNGNEKWNKVYDSGYYDVGTGIAVNSSGNVYVTGYTFDTESSQYQCKLRILEYDTDGTLKWNPFLNWDIEDYIPRIAADSENIYISSTFFNGTNYDFRTIKYYSSGALKWNNVYDSGGNDEAYGIATDSSHVYVTGDSNGKIRTIKYYTLGGDEAWNKVFDSILSESCGVTTDSSGDIYVVGNSLSSNGENLDFILLKYNTNGNITGINVYDSGGKDYACGIAVDSSKNVFISGCFYNGTNWDFRIIKYKQN